MLYIERAFYDFQCFNFVGVDMGGNGVYMAGVGMYDLYVFIIDDIQLFGFEVVEYWVQCIVIVFDEFEIWLFLQEVVGVYGLVD